MSCGGSMMRMNLQPLAILVDAAAEKWLAAEQATAAEQGRVGREITQSFKPGRLDAVTFHGLRYTLKVSHAENASVDSNRLSIAVHEIDSDES